MKNQTKVKGTIVRHESKNGPRFRAFGFHKKKIALGTHLTEALALEALRVFNESIQDETEVVTHGPGTLGEWVTEWWMRRQREEGHRSLRDTEMCIRRRILSHPISNMPIDSITPKVVTGWVKDQAAMPTRMKHGKPRRQTIVNSLNCLRVIMRDAVHDDRITTNPAAGIRVPKEARTDEKWTVLSIDEIRKVLSATCLSRTHRNFLTAAVFTGLRAGELFGLRISDVDLEKREIVVRHSYDGPTKSGHVRRVPLLGPAFEALKDQVEHSREGDRFREHPTERAFPLRKDKSPANSRTTNGHRHALKRALKEAGINRSVRVHDLRHSCASHLVSGSFGRAWSLMEVKQVLGHSAISTTTRYSHMEHGGIVRAAQETTFEL